MTATSPKDIVKMFVFAIIPNLFIYRLLVWLPSSNANFFEFVPLDGFALFFLVTHYGLFVITPFFVPTIESGRLFIRQNILALPLLIGSAFIVRRLHLPPPFQLPLTGTSSFHVVWAFSAAMALLKSRNTIRVPAAIWAVLVALGCLTAGLQTLFEIIVGLLIFIITFFVATKIAARQFD